MSGITDPYNPIADVRAFDAMMTARGVAQVHVEHDGGHVFVAEESLRFLPAHFAFETRDDRAVALPRVGRK